mgnify:FL=1
MDDESISKRLYPGNHKEQGAVSVSLFHRASWRGVFLGHSVGGRRYEGSADRYYDEVNYMDLKVLGTLGLTDDDLADIAKTDGVKAVYGGKTVEVLHDIGESEQVVKLIALTDGVNEPRVVEGRMPEKRG